MKPRRIFSVARLSLPFASALVALFTMQSASATSYYWDSDGATGGFGNTTGTWGTSAFWSTVAAGTGTTANTTITTADDVNFGTTLNYGNATVGIATGGVTANSIVFGSGQTTALTIGTATGAAITLGGTAPDIVVNSTGHRINAPIILATNSTISFGTAVAADASFTLGGVISGNFNMAFTTPNANSGNNPQTLTLSAASTYGGTTTIGTVNGGTTFSVRAGVANALPTTTVLSFNPGAGSGSGRTTSFDLNGNAQTIAGLAYTAALPTDRNIRVTSTGAATLTIDGSTSNSFGGSNVNLNTAIISGAISLVKNGTGTQTLTGANNYTGSTTVNNGTLTLSTTGTLAATTALRLGGGTFTSSGSAGQTVASLAVLSGGSTLNSTVAGFNLTLGAITRSAGGTVNFGTTTGGIITSTANVNGILGPYATFGTGASTRYAVANVGAITGLTGTAAATAANVTDTLGAVNYDVAAVGALPVGASPNTLRYTGAAGSITGDLITKGIMNAANPTGTLTFSGNVTAGAAAGAAGTSATEFVVNAANGAITFNGIVTGNLTKTGSGTVTLGTGAHSIGGWTVNQGILILNRDTAVVDQLPGGTVNSGGTVRLSGGNSRINNNGIITINAGGTMDLNNVTDQIGGISGAGSVTNSSGTSASLHFNTTGSNAFSGVIANGTGAIALIINGSGGTQTLTGLSTYTGTTEVRQGTLSINTIKNLSTASSIGAPTSIANGTIGLGLGATGTLVYTGTGDTTDRVINLAGTTSGGTITQSGAGATATTTGLLRFNALNFTATGAGSKTLTLNGSTTGTGEISGVIADNLAGTNNTSLAKSGTGTWTLSGLNTFTGDVTISGGTLVAGLAGNGTNSSLGSVVSTRTINVNTGGTLLANVAGGIFNNNFSSAATILPALNIAGGTMTNGGTATNSALGNITLAAGTLTAATGTGSASGYGVWNLNGTVTSTGVSTISNSSVRPITLSAALGTTTIFDVQSGTLTASAALGQITATGDERTSSLTKSGAGTMILSGTNTYTGATLVSGGTLTLSGTGAISNSSSGITISGSGAKFLQTSSVASSSGVTLTQGTLTGNGTVGAVGVADSALAIITNNNGVAGASLTTGALTFNGAATVNTFSTSTAAPVIAGALSTNAAGIVTITATAASWITGSTYNLISYTGGSIGGAGFGQFALNPVVGLSARQFASPLNNTGNAALTFTVNADNPKWTGLDSGGLWQLGTTGAFENWKLQTAGSATTFLAADDVLFDDSALGTKAVVINAANVSPTSTTFNNSLGNDYTVTGSFGIATGTLTKSNTGTVTLSTANTYTGTTTLNGGILRATTSATALGAGSLTLAGGELQLANDTGLSFGRNTTVTGNTQITSDTLGSVAGVTHTLGTLSIGGQTLTIDKGSNATGTTAGVTFGATTLTGAPTFAIGTGSTLNLAAVTNAGNTITLTGAGIFSQTGTLGGVGGLTLDSGFSGTATINSSSTNYSGATTISGGKLVLAYSATPSFVSAVTVNAGGTLQYSPSGAAGSTQSTGVGAISLLGNLTYAPTSNAFVVLGTSGVNKIVTVSGGASVINISPGAAFAASSGGLFLDGGLQGSSAVTVNATTNGFGLVLRTAGSTYSGAMIVNGTPSTLSGTGSGLALVGSGVNSTLANATLTINGTLELGNANPGMGWAATGTINGTTQSIDALNGTGVVVANMPTAGNTRTLSVGNNNGTGNFSGVIANGALGTLSFTKAGSGTQTLSGLSATAANNYSGSTTINQGTLALTTTNPSFTGGLSFGSANTNVTAGILDLTTANATFAGALLVNTNSVTANEIKIGAAQTLTINNNVQIGALLPAVTGTVTSLNMTGGGVFNVATAAAGTFNVGGTGAAVNNNSQVTTLDLTALSATTINTSATGTIRINASYPTNVSPTRSTLLLPTPVVADTVGTATLTTGTIAVGNSSTFNGTAGQINTLQLGTGLTTLNANTINVGTGSRDIGQIIFGQAGGDLKIRAADGTTRATALNVGAGGGGTATTEATTNNLVDFSGHDADILVTSLNVGNQPRTGNLISEFKFGAGDASLASVLDATNVNIGFRTGATGTNVLTNRVILSGGSVTFGNVGATGTGVDIGSSANSATAASTIGELNISGGNVTIYNSTSLGAAVRLGTNTVAGTGTVTASMNLTGGTTTLGGDIIRGATSPRTTSTVKISGGTLDMGGNDIGTATELITLTAESGTLKNVASINSTGGLTKTTAGTLLVSGTNGYTGGTTLTLGNIQIDSGSSLGSVNGTLTVTAGTLDVNGNDLGVGNFTGAGGTIVNNSIGTNKTLTIGNNNGTGGNYAGVIADNSGTGGTLAVIKTGTGTLTLSGTNTYSGSTSVSAGTLLATKAAALPGYTLASTVSVASTATLAVRAGGAGEWTSGEIDSVLGATTAAFASGSTLGIDVTTGNSFSYANDIGATQAAKGLVKSGAGALTVAGANTYTGATLVSAGTLFVTGSLTSDVTVSDTATVGGGGSVQAISFEGGSFFDIALALAGSPNPLDSTGTISFSGAGFGIDNLVSGGIPVNWASVADGTYTLITGTLTSTNLGNFGSGNAFDVGAGRSAYFQSGSLQLVVIPEPSAAALLGTLGALMLLRRRR